MDVHLTTEQADFIRQTVESGRFANVEDAVREAVRLLEQREHEIAELRALVDEGLADLENGEYVDYTDETLPEMIEDIRREARESHATEPKRK
jgi:antitoxin ParD1/3/4